MNISKFSEEYDIIKIALAIVIAIVIFGGIFAGVRLLTTGSLDIRERAAGPSCPGGTTPVTCTFEVEAEHPFKYQVEMRPDLQTIQLESPSIEPVLIDGGVDEIPSDGMITITESADVPYAETITCHIKIIYEPPNACEPITVEGEKACTPAQNPTPTEPDNPTPTDPDGGGTSPICNLCTKIDVDIDIDTNQPRPTLTPPNLFEESIKYGRVKISVLDNACSKDDIACAEINENGEVISPGLVVEFKAYQGDQCEGAVVPREPANKDNSFLSCEDAKDTEEGARFRLHQAAGNGCRCYGLNVEFISKEGADVTPAVCPANETFQVCCDETCTPNENGKFHDIIDLAENDTKHGGDIDGCPGDPDGPRPPGSPGVPPTCYFDFEEPANSCLRLNSETRIKAYTGGDEGVIEFDDDFRKEDRLGNMDIQEPVLDGQEYKYVYQDGGSYDITLKCKDSAGNVVASCTKRIKAACSSGGGPGDPGNPGDPTDPPTEPTIPACIVPDITGRCIPAGN